MATSKIFNSVPTVSASAIYASGDCLGQWVKIPNFFRNNGDTAKLKSMIVTDAAKQTDHIVAIFYNAQPSTIADNAAYAPTAGDLAKIIGILDYPSATMSAFSTNSAGDLIPVGATLELHGASKDVWYQLVIYGTPTYAAITDIALRLTAEYD